MHESTFGSIRGWAELLCRLLLRVLQRIPLSWRLSTAAQLNGTKRSSAKRSHPSTLRRQRCIQGVVGMTHHLVTSWCQDRCRFRVILIGPSSASRPAPAVSGRSRWRRNWDGSCCSRGRCCRRLASRQSCSSSRAFCSSHFVAPGRAAATMRAVGKRGMKPTWPSRRRASRSCSGRRRAPRSASPSSSGKSSFRDSSFVRQEQLARPATIMLRCHLWWMHPTSRSSSLILPATSICARLLCVEQARDPRGLCLAHRPAPNSPSA